MKAVFVAYICRWGRGVKGRPDSVVRDAEGKPYTVCYDAVNAMRLNKFLKEHRKFEQGDATIAQAKAAAAGPKGEIEAPIASVTVQADQIQIVSA